MDESIDWKKPLILAATLAVVGSLAYYLEFKRKPEQESKEELSKKFFELKAVPVAEMKLVNGPQTFGFSCQDQAAKLCKAGDQSKWEIQAPQSARGDESNVNALLSSIANTMAQDVLDLKEETADKKATLLKEYGLDEGSRSKVKRIELKLVDGKTRTIYLGEMHPIGDKYFSIVEADGKIEDNRVLLVPSTFATHFEKDLTYWRNKKIVSVSAFDIEKFAIDGAKAQFSAEKKDGLWTLKSKSGAGVEEYAGDIENVDSILAALTNLSAKAFAFDQKNDASAQKALKSGKATLKITFQPKGAGDVVFQFYEGKEKSFATISNLDPVFEVDAMIKDRLDKPVKELRLNKLITSMERFTAKRLEFSGKPAGEGGILLISADSKWYLDEAKKSEANSDQVTTLLDHLSGGRIKEFVAGKDIPAGESDGLRLTLGDEKDAKKRQMVFWKSGKEIFAKDLNSSRKEAYKLDMTLESSLPWNGKELFVAKKSDSNGK